MPLVAAAAIGAAGLIGAAKISSNASKRSGDLQAAGADKALTFEQQQAARDQANFAATQKGNYDQWAAREGRLGSLGELVGMGHREIPGYVPTTAGAAPGGAPAASGPAAPGGTFQSQVMSRLQGKPFNQQAVLDLEPWLNSVGSKLTPPAVNGDRTKIFDPETKQWVRLGFGEGHPVWVPQGGASAPTPRPSTIAAYLTPNATPFTAPRTGVTPGLPMPYAPGSIGAYMGA